jgi:hypothetical protein
MKESHIKTKPDRPYAGDTHGATGGNGSSQADNADFRAGAVSPEQESANAAFFAAGGVDARLAEILADIDKLLRDYIVFPNNAAAVAATLWVPHTWALDAFDFTPYLHLHSPVKECGKTRVFECLVKLCKNGWHTFGPTEAVLFRKINAHEPTLLLDEVDTVFKDKVDPKMEGIRAVLNAGYERGVVVPRCDGANHELKEFRVFGPKAFAGIGNIPDTIASRSIKIPIMRRRRDQKIKRLRKRELAAAVAAIVQALEGWSSDNIITRLQRRGEMPTELGDRGGYREPPVAIADMAGGEWPENAGGTGASADTG